MRQENPPVTERGQGGGESEWQHHSAGMQWTFASS